MNVNAYICLFMCSLSRAVYLEVVTVLKPSYKHFDGLFHASHSLV